MTLMPTAFWITTAASVASSLIVGLISAYLTANRAIAVLENRVSENEDDIETIEEEQNEISGQIDETNRKLTKIETLLEFLAANQENVEIS